MQRITALVVLVAFATGSLLVGSDAEEAISEETLTASASSDIVCGDADRSGEVNLADVVFVLNYLFSGGPAPDPPAAGDQNCDGAINIADCVYLLYYLYEPEGTAPCCFTDADYCPRKLTSDFDRVAALQMARLANEAYEVNSDLSPGSIVTDCWVAVKFITSDPDYDCDVAQIPNQDDTQLFVARDPWTGDLVVSFRGTGTVPDWLTDAQFIVPVDWRLDDFTVIPDAVHRGFYCAYQSIKEELKAVLVSSFPDLNEFPDARVYFTGHSLGGALAALAALDLSSGLRFAGYKKQNIVMYSFGAARAFKRNLYSVYSDYVPNHFLVMEKTDGVPYLLPTYAHVPRVAAINTRMVLDGGSFVIHSTRIDFGDGLGVIECGPIQDICPWSYDWVAGHDRESYITRLQKAISPGVPTVALGVESGLLYINLTGNIVGPCDMVTECWLCPSNYSPEDIEYISGAWGYAVNGDHVTPFPKSEGNKAQYVNSFGAVLAESAPYVAKRPTKLTIKRVLLTFLEIEWDVADEGLYDYVALYSEHPSTAGPNGYMFGRKHLVLPDGNDIWRVDMPRGQFWVAYVTANQLVGGQRRILRIAGPVN